MRVLPSAAALALFGVIVLVAPAAAGTTEPVDLDVVHRIKAEAFAKSQVPDTIAALADVVGPRLTGSTALEQAGDWAIKRLAEWGVPGAHRERWGTFGRPWAVTRFNVEQTAPYYARLDAVPRAFCAGTEGRVEGDLVAAPLFTGREEENVRWDLAKYGAQVDGYIAKWKGKLRGRMVLIDPSRNPGAAASKDPARYAATDLDDLMKAPEPRPAPAWEWPVERMPADEKERRALSATIPQEVWSDFQERRSKVQDRLNAFYKEEGVLAILASDRRGDEGLVFAERAGSWDAGSEPPAPTIVLASEAYNRLLRLLDRGAGPKVALDLGVAMGDKPAEVWNLIAEIPGGKRRNEVVMLGAHLDSWHGGTGATDNAAGCAAVLEAMRILKALNLPLDRTVRLALWTGEEQGLRGSRAYVREHFADAVTMARKPEHATLSGYFNLDNGSGKIRGVYLQGNDAMRPIFEAWFAPFADLGVTAITIRDTGSTDHRPFDAVGLPGFQFIQDQLDYMDRTHHSDLDVADKIEPGDLMQASAVIASVVYHAANRAALLPREPLPPPLPPKKQN
ncbi:MAG TPA: M20/M25/M40 family metallo-hydrolase [Candidatus Polarisedimenticolia bacterium]|nr:M20/M25/M40 family metallo-hydrolase [Candidatus Polarisedimenticolia bacterium]